MNASWDCRRAGSSSVFYQAYLLRSVNAHLVGFAQGIAEWAWFSLSTCLASARQSSSRVSGVALSPANGAVTAYWRVIRQPIYCLLSDTNRIHRLDDQERSHLMIAKWMRKFISKSCCQWYGVDYSIFEWIYTRCIDAEPLVAGCVWLLSVIIVSF